MTAKTCWTITRPFPGMKSQVTGLADALGLPTLHKTCEQRWPWGWLGLSIGNPLSQLTPGSDPLTPPWPDVVVTCGRRSAPLALAIKKQNKGKTFCVHIQNPLINQNSFDLIIAPEHDNFRGANVFLTKGALHKITHEKIQEGVAAHGSLFAGLPGPYNVVLLGGSTHKYTMTREAIHQLIQQILQIRETTKGSVLVTPSFRTPFRELLRKNLEGEPHIFLAEIEQVNPYFAMLGVADTLFVTDDSVNMLCEACFTGKPVYVLPLLGHRGAKSLNFIQELVSDKVIRLFEGKVEYWTYTPFNDTERAAKLVLAKMALPNPFKA